MLSKPYSLMIVDDQPEICEMIEFIVEHKFPGVFNIVATKDSEESMAQIKSKNFQVIITDLIIPKQSGYDVARVALEKNPGTQVIYLTGDVSFDVALTCYTEGAASIMFKPVEPKTVTQLLSMCLRRLDHWDSVFSKGDE